MSSVSPAAPASPERRFLSLFKPVWPGLLLGVALSVVWGLILLPVPLLF
jgi:hypothetical protein